jgi:RHS repeat-associated protein
MLPASKHLDIVMGIDVHIVMVPTPGGPVPTPLPHPFIGMLFDPGDYDLAAEAAKIGLDITPALDIKNMVDKVKGYSPSALVGKLADKAQNAINEYANVFPTPSKGLVKVNGLPRVHCGTPGYAMPPHFPMPPGVAFQAGKVGNECEAYMGSMTVAADQEPFSFMGCMVKTCHCPGSMKPTSVIITIPTGPLVLVGGPPVPSLALLSSKLFKKAFNKGFAKAMAALKKTKAAKWISQKIHNAAGKAMTKLGIPADSHHRDKVHKKICEKTGHPIIIATGVVVTSLTDFRLPGPIPLIWERNWKSTSRYEGPFGYGWHSNYDLALAYEEDAVVVRMEDGRPVIFPPVEVGNNFANPFENMTLFREENAYLLRDESNLYHRFEIKSKILKNDVLPLKSIETKAGHKIQFLYNNKNHLANIIDSGGRKLGVTCDSKGRITKIEAPHPEKKGETFTLVSYKYDDLGNLIESKDALNSPFLYEYKSHLLVKETNRNGLSFYFEYDGEDDKARCIHTWGDNGIFDHKLIYNLEERWTRVEDSLGNKSKYFWTDLGVNWKIVDPLGNESFKRYTQHHKVQAEINELGQITSYDYDEFGNKTAIYYPDGSTLKMQYAGGLLVGATDQNGGSWQWAYDENRQLVSKTNPVGKTTLFEHENGWLKKIINPAGGESLLDYDKYGNLVSFATPDGATSRWEHDLLGRTIESIDPKGNSRKRKHNFKGWVVRANDADGNHRELEYDPSGNIVHAKDNHHDVRFEYTFMNRLKARNEAGTRVEFKYDTEGNLLGIINEHGYAYRFDLDPNFRVVTESGFDGVTRRFQRDPAGKAVQVERAGGIITNYDFDPVGRVVAVRHSDDSSEKYVYRPDGELVEATNDHIAVKFERDALGRVLKEKQGGFTVESKYDMLGMRTEVFSSLGAHLTFGRNSMGDVEQVQFEGEDEGDTWEASFRRDISGLELERLMPGGVQSQWKRDRLGRPIEQKTFAAGGDLSLSRQYEWDVNYRLKKIIDSQGGTTQFEHDAVGNLSAAQYGDGTSEYRMPDAVGNLFKTKDQKDRKYGPAGQLLEADGTRYEYDAEGNLLKKTERNGATWHYEWNASGMLRRVVRPDGDDVTFTYDALGRRIAKQYRGKVTRWVWDGNKMLHEWVEVTSPQSAVRSPQPGEQEEATGRIKILRRDMQLAAAPSNGPPAFAETGPRRGKLETEDPEGVNWRLPTDITTWVFEPHSFAPLAKLMGGQQYSIVTDHLGTPVGMYNTEGRKVWAMDLSIFGEVRNMDGWREACPFRYPGQYEDVETGLYYNRFRYYDAEGGIFICKDPIGLKAGLNIYSYVKDSNSWIDPLGLSETFYRTVSEEDSKIIEETGKVPATTETTISPTKEQSDNYDGVTYKITVKDGTTAKLVDIGVRDQSNLVRETYPNMPEGESGWGQTNARFKAEKGQINIGLGTGDALDEFNENIESIEKCGSNE